MKSISKRILCILTSLMMLLPLMCVGVSAEVPTTYVFDANNYQVNNVHTEVLNLPSWLVYDSANGNAAAKPKVYKQTNILGLTGGEAAIEFVGKEDRAYTTSFKMQNIEFEADGDFYITMNFYVGDGGRDADFLGTLGTYQGYRYSDGAYAATKSSINSKMFMKGNGRVHPYAQDKNPWGSYEKGNWYSYTIAAKSKGDGSGRYEMTAYIDDISLTQYYSNSTANKADAIVKGEADGTIKINDFGLVSSSVNTTTDLFKTPHWWLIKDMKLVKGTYNPDEARTAITSTAYTVQSGSFGTGSATKDSYITGVSANTSVSTFLGNIDAPAGATKQVVEIAEDNLATTVVGNDAIVTSAMKLLVTSADGSMKLYDIDAAVDASLLPVISSNANYPAYVVDADAKKISIPDTTAAKLKERITLGEGTTVKVVDANGYEVADNKAVTNTMKLVASKNDNDVEYTLEISKNDLIQNKRMGEIDTITTENTTLYSATYGTAWTQDPTNGRIVPFNQSGGESAMFAINAAGEAVTPTAGSTYTLTSSKMPTSGAYAYKTTHTNFGGWASHQTVTMMQQTYDDVTDKILDKTVMSFKLYLEDGAAAVFAPYHDTKQVSTSGKNNKAQLGDALMFINNKISLGSAVTSSAVPTGTEIGTYQNNTEYDIKIVETTPDAVNGSDGITLEAIYVNNVKIYPTGNENVVLSSTTKAYGFHSFRWQTLGTAYWGDIQVYMTDNYALPEAAAAEADLSITSDDVTITGDRIYGWESIRTVADLKAKINSAATTEVEVLNIIGSAALAENAALENGMLFRVTDKNHPENTAYYVLAKTTTDSGTTVTVNDDKVTATRQVLVYTAESSPKSLTVILAVYEGDTLVSAKLDTKTIQAIGDYDFEVEIEGYNPATMTYKAFAWNLGTLVPYEGITD